MSAMPKKVLFLCTGNSCRSQMAEAWTRALHSDAIEAMSAGTDPHGIDPRAVRVMEEAGVDLSQQSSKGLEAIDLAALDLVVTVCDRARESCPVLPAPTRQMHVSFEDPPALARDAADEEEALRPYRRVRDEIAAFVRELPARLREESR